MFCQWADGEIEPEVFKKNPLGTNKSRRPLYLDEKKRDEGAVPKVSGSVTHGSSLYWRLTEAWVQISPIDLSRLIGNILTLWGVFSYYFGNCFCQMHCSTISNIFWKHLHFIGTFSLSGYSGWPWYSKSQKDLLMLLGFGNTICNWPSYWASMFSGNT